MIGKTSIIIFFLSLLGYATAYGSEEMVVAENNPEWKVYIGGAFVPYEDSDHAGVDAIYLELDATKRADVLLEITSHHHPVLFVNGQLFSRCQEVTTVLPIKDLTEFAGTKQLSLGIFQKGINPRVLLTRLKLDNTEKVIPWAFPKPEFFFRDFVVTASLLLLLGLVGLLKFNTRLTVDYFSVIKIFSGHDSDESQVNSRLGSGSAILYYAYSCFLISFLLIVIFRFTDDRYSMAWFFQADSFGMVLWTWLKMAVMLFGFYLLKVFWIFVFSRLFSMREVFAIHVFNWTRLILVSFGILTITLCIYFIFRGLSDWVYIIHLKALFWVFIIWFIILFPKVARRSSFSMFHLFSYLCATEIIPLLISIKILYH